MPGGYLPLRASAGAGLVARRAFGGDWPEGTGPGALLASDPPRWQHRPAGRQVPSGTDGWREGRCRKDTSSWLRRSAASGNGGLWAGGVSGDRAIGGGRASWSAISGLRRRLRCRGTNEMAPKHCSLRAAGGSDLAPEWPVDVGTSPGAQACQMLRSGFEPWDQPTKGIKDTACARFS